METHKQNSSEHINENLNKIEFLNKQLHNAKIHMFKKSQELKQIQDFIETTENQISQIESEITKLEQLEQLEQINQNIES